MKQKTKITQSDRGFATLETAGVLLIVMVITLLGAQKYNDYLDEKNWQLEALRLTTWTAAARQYVGDRYDTLVKSKPTAGKPYCLGTQSLKEAGLLPSGFALENPEGQTLRVCLVTLRKDASRLEGMVVSEGGVPLTQKAMLLTSRDIRQGYGGYIDKAGVATGAQKAWTAALTGYGINNGAAGHMAVLLSADDLTAARSSSQEDADRLYRFKTPGRPELNAMKTDIDMSGNNLNNTGDVNAKTGNFSGNVHAQDGHLRGNLDAGGSVNAWEGNFGGTVSANGNITGQNGYFRGRLTTNEYLQLGGLAQAGQGCYPNGLIGRNSRGGILSCEDGRWRASGQGGSVTRSANNALRMVAPDNFQYINVTIASKFNPRDGGHTSNALFNVIVNGTVIAQINNTMTVQKGGSRGHYWGYQTTAVAQKMYRYTVRQSDTIQIELVSGYLHASSDIQVTMSS